MKICEYCNKEFSDNISDEVIKRHQNNCTAHRKFLHKKLTREFLYNEYAVIGKSVIQISQENECSFRLIFSLIKKFEIHYRNMKEAKSTPYTKQKTINGILKKYGVKNAYQIQSVKENVKERYGVNNVFQLPQIIKRIRKTKEKNGTLGKTNGKKTSQTMANWTAEQKRQRSVRCSTTANATWNKMTKEQQEIKMMEMRKHRKKIHSSSLEFRIIDILEIMKLKYIHQFFVGPYSYDIRIKSSPIVLEINGDWVHANPKYYKENDVLTRYGGLKATAKEIWQYDKIKKEYIEKYKYKVYYLWENEIRKSNDFELIKVIEKIIYDSKNKID